MYKLKEDKIFFDKEETKKIYDESYVTETGFYIGTQTFIRDTISQELLNKLTSNVDEFVIFHLYCKFMVDRFVKSDVYSIYDYIEEYFEEDLADFIKEYFEE